jgi:hydrogenase maturation factor HypF (carbamoyltransferase family)
MKLIVCDSCEAEYQIKHNMNDRYYIIEYCTFCGADLSGELEDEIEWNEDD